MENENLVSKKNKRILIIHNRAFHSSGPETYLINLMDLLEKNQIQYSIFAMDYQKNNLKNLANELPKPLGDPSNYNLSKQSLTFFEKVNIFFSSIFNFNAAKKLNSHLKENKYTSCIILQYLGKISPSVLFVLKKYKIPTAIRQSDYGSICGLNTFLYEESFCTKCISKQSSVIRNNCFDSYTRSIHYYFVNRINYYSLRLTRPKIIFTNNFAKELSKKSSIYNSSKISVINTFGDDFFEAENRVYKYDFIYFGRISKDKGINELISSIADQDLDYRFLFVGDVSDDIEINQNKLPKNIIVQNKMDMKDLKILIIQSKFVIIPSKWFDNLPNTLIEAYSFGKPVIMPNHGSFKEFQTNSNLFFDKDLKCIKYAMEISNNDYEKASTEAKRIFTSQFSKSSHFNSLLNENII